jgi:carbamoyl-phosphate synthase large subunit
VAADADSFAWGLYKVKEAEILPKAHEDDYIQRVQDLVRRKSIDAIIPGSEIETEILSKYRNDFDVPVISNRSDLMPLMMNKSQALIRLKELGLPTIPTFMLTELESALSEFDFPFVFKPIVGSGGSKGVAICTSKEEFNHLASRVNWSENFCIQPLIGDENSEYTVGVLMSKDGGLIDSICMQRKLVGLSLLDARKVGEVSHSISTGYSQGFFVKNNRVQGFCEQLALNLGSTGPLNIQLRIHNDQIYVFEIHPRFSGTTPMRADVGFNEVDILLRNHLFEEEFDRIPYMYDVAVIRAFEHVVVPIDKLK